MLVASPDLIAGEVLPLADDAFSRYPLIQAVGTTDTWGHCAEKFSIKAQSASVLYVDSHGLAVDLARSGAGIALTSELIAMPLLATGELVAVSELTPPSEDGYYLNVVSQGARDAAEEFTRWLLAEITRVASDYQVRQKGEV